MTSRSIFGYEKYRHIIPFFWLIFCVEFDSGEKNTKIEVKNFPILNINENFLKNVKIDQKFDVKRNVTFDFVDGFCPFFDQIIRTCRVSFDKKFRTLGSFFQKLRFFNVLLVFIMQILVAAKEFFFKVLIIKIPR